MERKLTRQERMMERLNPKKNAGKLLGREDKKLRSKTKIGKYYLTTSLEETESYEDGARLGVAMYINTEAEEFSRFSNLFEKVSIYMKREVGLGSKVLKIFWIPDMYQGPIIRHKGETIKDYQQILAMLADQFFKVHGYESCRQYYLTEKDNFVHENPVNNSDPKLLEKIKELTINSKEKTGLIKELEARIDEQNKELKQKEEEIARLKAMLENSSSNNTSKVDYSMHYYEEDDKQEETTVATVATAINSFAGIGGSNGFGFNDAGDDDDDEFEETEKESTEITAEDEAEMEELDGFEI